MTLNSRMIAAEGRINRLAQRYRAVKGYVPVDLREAIQCLQYASSAAYQAAKAARDGEHHLAADYRQDQSNEIDSAHTVLDEVADRLATHAS